MLSQAKYNGLLSEKYRSSIMAATCQQRSAILSDFDCFAKQYLTDLNTSKFKYFGLILRLEAHEIF